jgi:hypothetical protein
MRAGNATGIIARIVSVLVVLSVVFGTVAADARGGRNDDCSQRQNDPDCK